MESKENYLQQAPSMLTYGQVRRYHTLARTLVLFVILSICSLYVWGEHVFERNKLQEAQGTVNERIP